MENNRPLSESTLAVFGAAGKFWSTHCAALTPLFKNVLNVDPKLSDGVDPVAATQAADIIFVTVSPDRALTDIFRQIREHINGKILIENLTTKDLDLLQKFHDAGASVCSIHTLVKTDSPHENQPVLVMPFGESTEARDVAVEILTALKMRIEFLAIELHAEIQAMFQRSHLMRRMEAHALVTVGREQGISLEQLNRILPASAQLDSLGFDRILMQDPEVSASIICAGLQTAAGRRFVECLQDFLTMMDCMVPKEWIKNLFAEDIDALGFTNIKKQEVKKKTDAIIKILSSNLEGG